MQITNSPDISNEQLQVTFDISGNLPVINITNLSTGPHLGNIVWWFVVTSPSGTFIHQGSQSTPDVTGAWTTFSLTDAWPMPFNSIEWSGAPYILTVYFQDSTGTVYSDPSYSASICRPSGNTQSSQNPYGLASTIVNVQCNNAAIYFEDTTATSYKGLSGTLVNSTLRVIYPIDPTYNIPTPFIANFSSPLLVPISYSSSNYQFLAYSVYSYALSPYVSVNIKYQTLDPKTNSAARTFSVFCNIDLMPLICEYQALIESIENGSCLDVQTANNKLLLINPKFALVTIGMQQPLTGIDVPRLIEEIQRIGGFTCNCCSAPSGIIPNNSSVIDGYTFSINPVCGDINGTVTQTGTNIQFNLEDKSYVFALTQTGTTAFSVTNATSGCVKTYTQTVNGTQLATDILNLIPTNSELVNLFNALVPNNTGGSLLIVDGKCIFSSSATFNYTFTLSNVPSNTTFALINSIQNGSKVTPLSFSLNLTNLTAFQTYLNSLGIGTFTVTNPSGQTVLITSNSNTNALSNLNYSIASTNYIANFTSAANGYVPLSANAVVQSIINYLCGLTEAQLTTSEPYTITYIDASGKTQTFTEPEGVTLSQLLSDILTYGATTITNISQSGAGGVSCTSFQKLFQTNTTPVAPTDLIYGTKGNNCAGISYLDAFSYMLTAGQSSPTIQNLFCKFVTSCGAGLQCAPYSFFNVVVSTYNALCTPIAGIVFTLS